MALNGPSTSSEVAIQMEELGGVDETTRIVASEEKGELMIYQ